MASPLDSSQFVRLLDNRLREVAENRYKELPAMIPQIYRTITSSMAHQRNLGAGGRSTRR